MRIRGTNVIVNPVYWAHQRPWPFRVAVDYDVTEEEYAAITADARIECVVVPDAPVPVPVVEPAPVVASVRAPAEVVFSEPGEMEQPDETPADKRGSGRPRKRG